MKHYNWDDPQTNDLIILLQDIDLIPSDLTVDKIIEQVKENQHFNINILSVLHTLAPEILAFEMESLPNPIKNYELITNLILWSKGTFEPEHWQIYYTSDKPDIWDIIFQFTLNGKNDTSVIPYKKNWVDIFFIKTINQALRNAQLDGQFCIVLMSHTGIILFLKESQITQLLHRKLIRFQYI